MINTKTGKIDKLIIPVLLKYAPTINKNNKTKARIVKTIAILGK
ncbi:unnamed protein product, partial [marine sediment metagenome]